MTAPSKSQSAPPVPLARGFEPATRDAWMALVHKALKGADYKKRLVATTADGLALDPLYTRADAMSGTAADRPGAAPFTRGSKARRDGLGWDIRQMVIETDPAAANAAIRDDLDGGVTSIVLQIAPKGGGLAPDQATLASALDGVMLDLCPISLVAFEETATAAKSLMAIWQKRGVPNDQRKGSFGADPLGLLAMTGALADPAGKALAGAANLAKDSLSMPGVTVLSVDAVPYHVAGASEAQELAAMLATLVAYLRAMEAAGIAPGDALPKIQFALAVDDDQFLGIAKLRAARRLVWRVAEACGAGAAVARVPFTAVTSWRMMAKRDPWTNILRTTIACVTAALGGADAICVLPFTFALGKPDAFARRVARNIQIVCQEESNLGRVTDPAGGSWYLEKLTDDLAGKAWVLFQDIEAKGGMLAALQSGFVQSEIAKVAEARAEAIATGRMELTGVSAFPLLGDDGVKVAPWPAMKPGPERTGTRVAPLKMARFAEPFEALRDAADAARVRPRIFLASLGEIIDHNVRSTWIKNYLAAGGIEALMSEGYKDAAEAAKAFKASGTTAACICSSDAINATHADATARALKGAGAKLVLMAGRPGDKETSLKAAGVDQFLFAGQDAVQVLGGLQEKLG